MNIRRKAGLAHSAAAVVLLFAGLSSAVAQTVPVDAALLESLQQLIQQQQQQLQQQQLQLQQQNETIETLKARVDDLDQKSTQAQTTASQAQSTAEKAIDTAQRGTEQQGPLVTSGNEKVKLAISGQVNRAVNFADDGNSTKTYFVDNDTSNSRLRFVGTGQIAKETTLGSTLEVAFSPNNSFDVSQDDETTDDVIDLRKVEITLRNDNFGQLSIGKGSAAADDTAEYDLSLVAGPIMYSGVSDIIGGLQFTNNGALTGITAGDAFFNYDGNRQDRVRIDSPVFLEGAQVSVSAGSDDRFDAALTWGGDFGDWTGVDVGPVTTLGAVSIREPDSSSVDWRLAGSFSALHNPSGISLTVSGGMDSRDDSRDDPYNLYGKLAWDTEFFGFGPTGFGIDATYGENATADGDESTSFGLAAIQLIEEFGWEVYGQVRFFGLDQDTSDPDDIIVGTVGTRLKF